MSVLGVIVGGAAGAGVVLLLAPFGRKTVAGRPESEGRERRHPRPDAARAGRRRELALAAAAGLAALAITHWPMALPLGGAAVLSLRGLRSDASKETLDRLEAIATWTEMLRDTLAGASGLSQALIATAPTAPSALRTHVRRLADRLGAGMPAEEALAMLAAELDDPASDLIVASLVMASRERAQRLGELLGALASSAREEITMRLGVEASRASARSAVRMMTGFSLGLFLLMSVFARSYLEPYRAATGQLVLGIVGVVFGFGLYLMGVMIRPKAFPRLEMAVSS